MTDLAGGGATARALQIDYAFIEYLEGGLVLSGYVPVSGKSQSGVTIGCGVDLGQRDEAELRRWGSAPDLIDQLRPYLGLQKEAAEAALELAPLEVTEETARFLSIAARQSITQSLGLFYERDSGGCLSELPPAAQTVIASVAYQYGAGLRSECPAFWRTACRQHWGAMEAELRDFKDSYASRRIQEADYLKAGLAAR
tara:strand:+ start:160 stop:753 length:594 start_codon:yes stop_codon:yes gene_type:complete